MAEVEQEAVGGMAQPITYNYHGTQNPGDYWTLTFTDGNFTATNVTLNQKVSGTTRALTGGSEGFTELTTTTNDKAYALIIPGTGLVAAEAPFEWVDHGTPGNQDLQYLS